MFALCQKTTGCVVKTSQRPVFTMQVVTLVESFVHNRK